MGTLPSAITNKGYGKGIYRRRILLTGHTNKVVAELEDYIHGFRATLRHDGNVVTDIIGEAIRYPLNTCGGATQPIKALIGADITADSKGLRAIADPKANCTHLYDLTQLAIAHCRRGEVTWQYDVTIKDEKAGIIDARVHRNEQEIHHWLIEGESIQAPQALQGKPALNGFYNWAVNDFDEDEREAAFVLHKGFFVSRARRWDVAALEQPNKDHPTKVGSCYSRSEELADLAYPLKGFVRDFTDTPEELLKFK